MAPANTPPSNQRNATHSVKPAINKPVDHFQEGSVHVSIWEKMGNKGAFRTASFQLRYRAGEDWKSSQSYGLADLENLEKAAHEARQRIDRWQKPAMTLS
jgi:hypothetical protein